MANNTVPTYDEWLKVRQNDTNENRARAGAYHDAEREQNQWFWKWIRDSFYELNSIYMALQWADGYRREDNAKLLQIIRDKQMKIEQMFKMFLGLDYSATQQDIEERAKILGNFVDSLIEKAKLITEKEQQLAEKAFKEK